MNQSSLAPVHPGEVLFEEFMKPLGVTQYRLAKETAVPPRRINEIVQQQRSITPDTALRLAKFFGTSEMFWLNLQARYDLALQKHKIGAGLSSLRSLAQLRKNASTAPGDIPATGRATKNRTARSEYRRKAK